ncbi:tryptophan 2,3-dioxygenase family protein [Puia sp. P3]|uniref:tryptophan 2,3-dioxygenase family protein n=1 Tax=Puia sp. P3 TaxID=3423952 RepID=UPI003D673262
MPLNFNRSAMHYSDYLQLDKILNAQEPEGERLGEPAHDEMLFIVIHQAYELWFHQSLYEVDSVIGIFGRPTLNDNSPELQTIVHRLSRCATILKVLVHQIDIMETMTPMDFLDFRDKLRPASGFPERPVQAAGSKAGPEIRTPLRPAVLPLPAAPAEKSTGSNRRRRNPPCSSCSTAGSNGCLRYGPAQRRPTRAGRGRAPEPQIHPKTRC